MKTYPLDRRLGGPQSLSASYGIEKNLLPLPVIEPRPSILYLIAILLGKPEGRTPQGRPTCRWMNNIKMVLSENGWGGMYGLLHLAQGRDQWRALVKTVRNLRVP
jgi:hypothetical protein